MIKPSKYILCIITTMIVFCHSGYSHGEVVEMTIAGELREFIIQSPSGDAPLEGWPVIILLHGAGLSASEQWYGCVGLNDCGGRNFRASAVAREYFTSIE